MFAKVLSAASSSLGFPRRSILLCAVFVLGLGWGVSAQAQTVHLTYNETVAVSVSTDLYLGVAVDGDGNIYVAAYNSNAVEKYAPDGSGGYTFVQNIGTGVTPYAVAVDRSGNVYIADGDNHRILKETLSGGSYTQAVIVGPAGLGYTAAVAVDVSGNVYIVDQSNDAVHKYAPNGGGGYIFVTDVATGLSNPFGAAVDSSGNVYVADTGNHRVLKETLSGSSYTQSVVADSSKLGQPRAVAVDGSGNLYIADNSNNVVYEYAPNGGGGYTFVQNIGTALTPFGVAVDSSGSIYIVQGVTTIQRVVKESLPIQNFGSIPVRSTSAPLTVTFMFDTGGTLASTPYGVLTQGTPNLDFAAATSQPSTACVTSHTYSVGDTCTVDVTFTPMFPGVRYGAAVLKDTSGNVIATGYVFGVGMAPQVAFSPATESVVLSDPSKTASYVDVAVDSAYNLYLGTRGLAATLKVPWNGSSYGSPLTVASGLTGPTFTSVDGGGNLYISNTDAFQILKLPWNGSVYGTRTTILSDVTYPKGLPSDGSGNLYINEGLGANQLQELPQTNSVFGPPVTLATGFSDPWGVALDTKGNVYVADSNNGRVVKLSWNGNGFNAPQNVVTGRRYPFDVEADSNGNLYVTEAQANDVLKVQWNGTSYGSPTVILSAGLNNPNGLARDSNGNLYITDVSNYRVLKEDYATPPSLQFGSTALGATSATKTVSVQNIGNAVLAINGSTFSGDFVQDPSGTCNGLLTLAANSQCTMVVAFKPQAVGTRSGTVVLTDNSLNAPSPYITQTINLTGTGVAPTITITPSTLPNGAAGVPYSQTLTAMGGVTPPYIFAVTAGSLPAGLTLNAATGGISGTPITTGTYSFTITATDSAASAIGGPFTGTANYTVAIKVMPTVMVASSLNPSVYLQSVTFTGTVPAGATGAITFQDNGVTIGGAVLIVGGTGTLATNVLRPGSHPITAVYSGDANFSSATSAILSQMVLPNTTTTLTASPSSSSSSPLAPHTVVTLTATVLAGATPVQPGMVTFCDATAPRCTGLAVLGTAQLTTTGPAMLKFVPGGGSHSYKAIFAGTPGHSISSSSPQPVTALSSTATSISFTGSVGNYTLKATVVGTGNFATGPTGNVSFLDATSSNRVLGTATLGAATLAQSFVKATSSPFAAGSSPTGIATGDFNGDGIPDLATSNSTSGNVTVLLGNGLGGFAPAPGSPIAVGNGPQSVAVADFNGDGIADLAVANRLDSTVTILLGNGAGGFTPASGSPVATSYRPFVSAVGDFNGDGIADLAVQSGGTTLVTILLGNGSGGFTPAAGSPVTVGHAPRFVVIGDFNGDGIEDLAVVNSFDNNVTILLGDGKGGFAPAAGSPIAVGNDPEGLALGDFNGDGIDDLAVTNLADNNVIILLGNGNASFTPAAGSPIAVGSSPRYITVGDVNGDGIPDLAVSNTSSNNITLLLGNGSGGFTAASSSPVAVVNQPQQAVLMDLNGDGTADLAVVNYGTANVSVLLNQVTQTSTASLPGVNVVGTGTHIVNASYPGDTNYASSASPTIALTATPIMTSIVLTATPISSTYSQQVTLTATLTLQNSSPPSTNGETVTFYSGANPLGTGTLINNVATLNLTSLSVGTNNLTVQYGGNPTTYLLSSTSPVLPYVVMKATPGMAGMAAVMVSSNNNPSIFGQSVTFTATVPVGATGTVMFMDDSTLLSTGTITGTTATFTTSTLAGGTHPITAVYSGDVSFNGATSAEFLQMVTMAASTTALSLNPATIMYGDTSEMTATVLPAGATGTATFSSMPTAGGAAIVLGTSSLDGTGTAVFPENILGAGTYNITVHYNGDPNYSANTSNAAMLTVTPRKGPGPGGAALTVTVNDASRTTTQTNPPFSYTVAGTLVNGDTDATAVTGAPAYTSNTGSTSGTFPITVAGLTSANYVLTFVPGTLTVVPMSTTTTLTASPTSLQYGNPVTLTATVVPSAVTGTVSFYDSLIYLGQGNVSGGVAVLTTSTLNAGTHAITAIYNGDASYATSESSPDTVTVAKKTGPELGGAALTATVENASREYGTANPQFAYVVTGTLVNDDTYPTAVTGVPIYTSTDMVASPVGSTFPVNISGLASQNYLITIVPGTLTIVAASTTTALSANATETQYGDPLTLTAAVAPSGATGTVVFSNGSTVLGTGGVSGGVATLTTSTLNAGTYVITANYGGDGNYGASTSSPVTVTVAKKSAGPGRAADLTVTVANANRRYGQGDPAFAYSVTGTLVNGETYATALTGVPVYATTATETSPVGTYPISLTGGLNSENYVLTFVNGTLTVSKGTPVVTVTSSLNRSTFSQSVTFTAAISAGAIGTVTFRDGTTVLGTTSIMGTTATLNIATLAVGTHSITAAYSGDANYNDVTSAAIIQVVSSPADFAIAAMPASQVIPPGASTTYSINIPSVTAPFMNPVTLTATGLAAGATYSFTPSTVTPGTAGATSNLIISVPKQSAALHRGSSLILAVLLLPFAALRRVRNKSTAPRLLLYLLFSLVALESMVACGTGGYFSQPQQTYTITITGSSGSLVHDTTVSLTVE